MKKKICLSLLVIALIITGALSGCSSPGALIDEAAVRVYADSITETTMKGLSDNSLADYVKHGNAAFKAAVTQEIFDKAVTQINGSLGSFVSAAFTHGEEKDGYIIVHYKATYTKGEVGLRMVFDKNQLLAGQWFE